MNIKLDRTYYLQTDEYNFMLVRYDDKDNKRVDGYYGTLEQLINSFINIKLRKSKATTLKELKSDLDKLKSEIRNQLNIKEGSDK